MSYIGFSLRLSDHQKSLLRSAFRNKKPVTLQVSASDIGIGDKLMLTQRQINHLQAAARAGAGARITLSATQMKQNGGSKNGSGMFLPGTTLDRRHFGRGMQLAGTGMMLPAGR